MQYREICKILGYYLSGFVIALLVPLSVAVYYRYVADPTAHPQPHVVSSFLFTIFICLGLAFLFSAIGSRAKGTLYMREGLATVALIWFLTPALAALPFLFSGTLKSPAFAYFEMASGLTTTGSTILYPKKYDGTTGQEVPYHKLICGEKSTEYIFYGTVDPIRDSKTQEISFEGIEAISKALLFWRSFMQWLGGGGIVVLFVAILPALGIGGKMLYQAEVPGPIKETLTPRVKETAINLWKIYIGLTFLQIVLLMVTNAEMGWFDATTISFSTIATGGFSVHNTSIGFYANPYTEWVVILFMFLGGVNFSLYYYCLRCRFYRVYEPEFVLFLIVVILSAGFASWHLVGQEKFLLTGEKGGIFTLSEAIRYGTFQVVSSQTTTGFSTADYDQWPFVLQVLMLILMYVGGMSGSTSGGIKMMRHYMLFRITQDKVESLFRPNAVKAFRIGDKEVDQSIAVTVLCFFLTVIVFSALGVFLLVADGVDPETAVSVIAANINNSGFAFRASGPTEACAFLSSFGAILSAIWMIFGRLEFFAILVLLVPAFWKQE